MLKITFYLNDVATVQGFHSKDGEKISIPAPVTVGHIAAGQIIQKLTEQNKQGTIEATIIVERKPGAYELPKLERANSIFGEV